MESNFKPIAVREILKGCIYDFTTGYERHWSEDLTTILKYRAEQRSPIIPSTQVYLFKSDSRPEFFGMVIKHCLN